MSLSNKEQRKLLNKAWDAGHWSSAYQPWTFHQPAKSKTRYQDVSKIIKEAQEKERPAWENLDKDRRQT